MPYALAVKQHYAKSKHPVYQIIKVFEEEQDLNWINERLERYAILFNVPIDDIIIVYGQ